MKQVVISMIYIKIALTIFLLALPFVSCSEEEKKHSSYCTEEFDLFDFWTLVVCLVWIALIWWLL